MSAPIQGQGASAVAVKAAFLLNFARFTTWPAEALPPAAPIMVCVADEAVAEAFGTLASGRLVDGHPLEPLPVTSRDSLEPCTVLFIGRAASADARAMLGRVAGRSVLTVSDVGGFADLGGVIELYVEEDRMRFSVNLPVARAAGLTLSSQLLSLARMVGR